MYHDICLYGPLAEKYGPLHTFAITTAPEGLRGLAANYKSFLSDFRDGYYKLVIGDKETGTVLTDESLNFRLGNKRKQVHVIPVAAGSGGGGNHSGLKIVSSLVILTAVAWGTGGFGLAGAGGLGGLGGAAGASTGSFGLVDASAALTGQGLGTGGILSTIGASLGQTAISLGSLGSITYGNIASVGFALLVGGIANALAPIQSRGTDGSFLFNGAVNTSQEGSPIPLVYGTFQVGSIVISSGLVIEQNPPTQPTPPTI